MNLKCIAIDDEALALELLEDNIKKVPFLTLVKTCRNAFEALEVLKSEKIDLLFLDIQMPGLSGTQLLQGMADPKPMVIFHTAYQQYALEGFNLDVVDYLLKPVTFERFLKACTKAQELSKLKQSGHQGLSIADDYIFVNADYSLVKIKLSDITHIEGLKDYIKIHLSSVNRPVVTRLTMKLVEERLSTERFIRVHKSFIISLDKMESVRNLKIKIGTNQIPVSEFYSEAFFKAIETGRMDN